MIIAGHGRLLAARKLDMDMVPTICLEHLSDQDKKAYILADNKLALNAGWDDELLKLELGGLMDDFDPSLLGFDVDEIKKLFDDGDDDEPEDKDYDSKYSVIIDCTDETEQEMVFEHLKAEGYTCRVLSL